MAKQVKIGDPIVLGKVGYVRLPDGAVVTSGPEYIVRHEGAHVAVVPGQDNVEYDAVDPEKATKPAAPKSTGKK